VVVTRGMPPYNRSVMSITTSLPDLERRNPAVRILSYTVGLLLALALIAFWFLYWMARSPLPQLDGSISVHGLSSKVRVVRDEHGVPTIEAATLDDLFFAQGYITAQDRLWQMDLMRRAAAGELSEIIGEATLKMDREQRILGLRIGADAAVRMLSARDRTYFEDYARGVNAFLASHRNRLPLEFRLLRYQPRPWTVTDSLLVGARMVEDLNHYSYARALTREKILAKLGPELTADLYVNSSWRDRPPTHLRRDMAEEPAAGSGAEDDEEEEEVDPSGETNHLISAFAQSDDELFRPGSNNWVISGLHTVTGKPLLSNDMHLNHQMPNLWFEAHLRTSSGSFDVAGVTLPGVPFVIVGHNRRIGWGFTNLGPTVEDDYIEEFNERGQYKTPAGWRDPERRHEVIRVKGEPEVTLEVLATRHGPIISELLPGETRRIALRWTLYDGIGLPFFEVNSAANWEEFRKAFSTFWAPGQNVMYGDIDGHIGYQATGRVPIRSGDGSLPVAGSDDAHEWKGYIPFDDLPRVYDPATGILATANGRIAPDKYQYSISTDWDAPWRTDRIYRVLESGKKFAPADMLALQMDVSSTYDRFCAEKFVYALDHAANLSSRAKRAAEILRDWDGRMEANSAAPTIETKARQELARMLLEAKLGPAPKDPLSGELNWRSYRWGMSTVWLETVLIKQPARWLPPAYSDYGSLLTAAVETALQQPGVPADVSQWKWGNNDPVEINHLVLGRLPLIGRWTGPGIHPLSGSRQTVKAVGRGFGPSERLTWNFANFDQSTLNLVTGESGIFLSPYYMDQWRAWYEGSTFAFPFSNEAVEKHKVHEMTLE
jgi:penicillin G amidase